MATSTSEKAVTDYGGRFQLESRIQETESEIVQWELKNDRGLPSEALTRENKLTALRDRLENLRTLRDIPQAAVAGFEKLTDAELAALVSSNRPHTAAPGKIPATPVQRAAVQDAAILDALKNRGLDPLALPRNEAGKAGVKSEIRRDMGTNGMWAGATVFDKAWDRLRKSGEIRDRQ